MSGNYPNSAETSLSKIVRAIRDLYEGRSNAVGSFSCTTGAATTTVTAPNCAPTSKILLTPTHANAAAGLAVTYISAKNQGSFVVTHANSATANRNFDYAIQG